MATVSIRMNEHDLEELDQLALAHGLARSDYVRRALEAMKVAHEAENRRFRLQKASLRTRQESLVVNAEFAAVETDPSA
ncbi:MAG: ribbon-helix-helix protein, CopG family [Spirochaetales bacterium]